MKKEKSNLLCIADVEDDSPANYLPPPSSPQTGSLSFVNTYHTIENCIA